MTTNALVLDVVYAVCTTGLLIFTMHSITKMVVEYVNKH